jgi:lysophospholipid acyltransferase (LPLAT)-like uncharacterized protein
LKGFFRSGPVQSALAFLLWAYLEAIVRTIRWTRINDEGMAAYVNGDRAAIGCFWHEHIPLSIAAKPTVNRRSTKILISLSPDGEFVARAMVRHNMPSIRGSSGKKSDRAKAKGGVAAFREALEFLAAKGVLAVAPDGPRGPAREMAAGVVSMAKRSQAGVFFMGLAATPAKRLNTWDRMVLPGLFGRGCILWDGPHYCPPDADETAMAAMAADWGARLTAACDRAEAQLR